jgi:ADP-heptose:LPS heptosyltransferase
MLEALRNSLGERLAVFKLRKANDNVISFTHALKDARDILLVLPLDNRDLLAMMELLEMVKERFAPRSISIVGDENGREILRLLPESNFIHVRAADLTMLFHPRHAFIQQLKQRYHDIAIDLNLDLVLPSAYICKESNARVRIGFKRKFADSFFNFQIQPDPSQNRKLVYDRLAKCLDMF